YVVPCVSPYHLILLHTHPTPSPPGLTFTPIHLLLTPPPPPRSTLFPYTTLFRSLCGTVIGVTIVAKPEFIFGPDESKSFEGMFQDRKSTRLNSSHGSISYAVFCLKKNIHDRARTVITT